MAMIIQLVLGCQIVVSSCALAQDTPRPATTTLPESPQQESPQQLILVIGAPGTDEYATNFRSWAERWEEAAQRSGIPCTVIGKRRAASSAAVTPAETPEPASPADASPEQTDAARLIGAIETLNLLKSSEPLWVVYLGHGTFDGRTASWNLHGPDITAEQLANTCKKLQRPLATVICSSCSAPFINALSGPDRIIVTATKDGNQIQYCRFGDAMSMAISTLEADINRDGQTSLLEAWLFASRRTAEFYKTEGRLATEHSLIDDNGDGKGVRSELYVGDRIVENAESPELIDGREAARWHFVRSDEERRLSSEQREKRDSLEAQLEQLRKTRDQYSEAEYLGQIETIVLQLAEIYEAADK
ncbi:MAG: hypothetical protein U0936_26185 [Planctomycetaceae bacterium]